MSSTATLPKPIQRKIGGLRRHLGRIDLVLGLTRVTLAVLAFVVATFVLDRLLEFPAAFRAVLLALGAGGTGFVAWRHLIAPLAVRRSDDDVALLVERAHPELNDELISAVQLSRGAAGGGAAFHSDELVREVIAGAAERAVRIDFGRIAETGRVKRLAFLTVLVAAAVGALFATRARDARIWFERMVLLAQTPWPRAVEIEVHVSEPVVARGDDVTITARVLRGAPSRVTVHPTFAVSGSAGEIAMVEARGLWRTTLENVNEPFRFTVEGGDFRSPAYAVDVRARPKLDEIRLWLVHPAYTGIPDTPAGEPLHDGNLKVPAGTLVRYEARATEPLRSAEATFAAPQAVADVRGPELGGAAGGAESRLFWGEFRVKDSTALTVRLVSHDGFESPLAAQYQIRAVPDRLPDVRIVEPGRNKDVASEAAVPLKVEVRDDYRLEGAALAFTVAGSKRGKAEPGQEAETRVALEGLPAGDGTKAVTIDHVFDIGRVGVEAGERITYWVEAVDNRAPSPDVTSVGPESRGRSERYQLTVVADDELERQQQAALKRVRDDLLALARSERATSSDLQALAGELGSRREPDSRDRRRLTYAELDQRKVGQRLEAARRAFAEVGAEMASNKVGKEDDVRWLGELEATADQLVRDPIARAAASLQALRQAERPDPAAVLDVTRTQAEITAGLEDLVRRLDKWDEFNEVVRDLRDLIQLQEKIQKDTQERVKEELKK